MYSPSTDITRVRYLDQFHATNHHSSSRPNFTINLTSARTNTEKVNNLKEIDPKTNREDNGLVGAGLRIW